jgi:hypothetical protein
VLCRTPQRGGGAYETEKSTAVSGTLPVALILSSTVRPQRKCLQSHRTNSFLCILYPVRFVSLSRVSSQINTHANTLIYWYVLPLSSDICSVSHGQKKTWSVYVVLYLDWRRSRQLLTFSSVGCVTINGKMHGSVYGIMWSTVPEIFYDHETTVSTDGLRVKNPTRDLPNM